MTTFTTRRIMGDVHDTVSRSGTTLHYINGVLQMPEKKTKNATKRIDSVYAIVGTDIDGTEYMHSAYDRRSTARTELKLIKQPAIRLPKVVEYRRLKK